jgi:transposase
MAWRRGQAYSQDLRDRILVAVGSAREVAARFGVSVSYVIKAKQRRDRFDETAARPQRSHTPRRLARWHEAIRAHVRAHPDATLDELRAWLLDAHGIRVSMGLMWNTLDRLRLTLKKTAAGGRTGAGGCCRGAPALRQTAEAARFRTLGISRRNLDQDQHDAVTRPCAAW